MSPLFFKKYLNRTSRFLLLCFFTSFFYSDHSYCQVQKASIQVYLDTLASESMSGRGYVDNGMGKAANYISGFFSKNGLDLLSKNYRQSFQYDVNVFDGVVALSLNNISLKPGRDFIVTPGSRGVKASGNLEQLDSIRWINPSNRVVIQMVEKLTWGVSAVQDDYTVFQVVKSSLQKMPVSFDANVDAKRIKNFKAENIVAMVKGTRMPDSFLVLTAHYDHLGKLGHQKGSGEVIFRGANDNASGVALMLNLAENIAKEPLPYSVVFIAFAGEEAGLLGSEYFVKHPLIPLDKIRFLVNMDLLGTGDEGIMVVNATEFPKEWAMLDSLNTQNGFLSKIGQRGKAMNSDHYWFTEVGVPAFFIYTLGGIKAYHDVFDLPETLPLTKTVEVGQLIQLFFHQLSGQE